MVNFNITKELTEKAITEICHNNTAIPGMLILYSIFGIVLFLTGLSFKEKDSSWGKFFWIWITTMIGVGVFLIFLIFSPGIIQWVIEIWNLLWV